MFVSLKRILKFAWQGFYRNKGLSAQVIFIMAVAVFFGTSLFLVREIGLFLIKEAQKKVDMAVYFKKDSTEDSILAVKEELSKLSEQIERVEYVSKTQALESFKQKHKEDRVYLQALEEIEDNPFLASLNIKAHNPQHYAYISNFLQEGVFRNIIEKISYSSYGQNKRVIDRLSAITYKLKRVGVISGLVLSVLVILITYNTVKLAISFSKEEIATMRLVGAPNWFIRTPFLVQGIFYGIFAILIVDIIFFAGFLSLNSKIQAGLLNFDILASFKKSFPMIFAGQIIFIALLGIVSSWLAVRRYLKI